MKSASFGRGAILLWAYASDHQFGNDVAHINLEIEALHRRACEMPGFRLYRRRDRRVRHKFARPRHFTGKPLEGRSLPRAGRPECRGSNRRLPTRAVDLPSQTAR